MKHILLTLLLFIFIFPSAVDAGCFPREDIASKATVTPTLPCLDIHVGPGCVGVVELDITNHCNDILIYEKDGRKIELYKHSEWLKVYKTNSNAIHYFYDRDVPQEYITWSRELHYKDDPNKKILIEVENIPVEHLKINYAHIFVAVAIIIFVIMILFYVFRKKKVSK
jgi:hypothetical protein